MFVPISRITNLYLTCIPNIKRKIQKTCFDSRMTRLDPKVMVHSTGVDRFQQLDRPTVRKHNSSLAYIRQINNAV